MIDEIKNRMIILLDEQLVEGYYFDIPLRNFMDSLDLVEYVMACEREFEVDIQTKEMVSITKLDDLLNLLNDKLNGNLK